MSQVIFRAKNLKSGSHVVHLFGTHYQPISELCQHYLISNLTSKSSRSPQICNALVFVLFVSKCEEMYVEREDGGEGWGDSEWKGEG